MDEQSIIDQDISDKRKQHNQLFLDVDEDEEENSRLIQVKVSNNAKLINEFR